MRQDALWKGNSDAIDAIVEQWHRERPELDPSAKQITGRIIRLTSLFQDAYSEAFAPIGMSDADYGVLAALRRSGAPYRLTPTELAHHRMMTSGGMTAAIDRLARRSMLRRLPNPQDRRGSLIELTEVGLRAIDAAMTVHADVEHRLIEVLTPSERAQLERLLRKLLRHTDPRAER